jgi:hypothetical protein
MAFVAVEGRVEDFAGWRKRFEEGATLRRSGGVKGEQVLRQSDDGQHILVLYEVEDVQQARQYLESEEIRRRRHEVGVRDVRFYYPET